MMTKKVKNMKNNISRMEKAEAKINKIRSNICQKRYPKIKLSLIFILSYMLIYGLYLLEKNISYENSFIGYCVSAFLLYSGYIAFQDYFFHKKLDKKIKKIKKNYSN